jgi:hypothetical protein
MQMRDDSLLPICADLYAQIEQLEQNCRAMTVPALHAAVDSIRATAKTYHLLALEGIASAFEHAIAEDRKSTAFALYFDQLKLATGCRAADEADARDAMLAAISVRMTG